VRAAEAPRGGWSVGLVGAGRVRGDRTGVTARKVLERMLLRSSVEDAPLVYPVERIQQACLVTQEHFTLA